QGVVRVMTVHASKGLEFPIVAVAELWGTGREKLDAIVAENVGSDIFAALIPKEVRDHLPDEAELPASAGAPLEDWAAYLAKLHRDSERAERGRLLYVALTRAKEALILGLSVNVTAKTNPYGTNWGPRLASDACTALFGDRLPMPGLSSIGYGGSADALVRHVAVDRTVVDDEGVPDIPFDAGGSYVHMPPAVPDTRSMALFDPAVDDGIAEVRGVSRPRRMRSGTFSYSSVHAQLAASAGEEGNAPQPPADEVLHRAIAVVEEEDDASAEPLTADSDKATNLGSAFHQLAQSMVESGTAPSAARIAAAGRTWQLTRQQRARLSAAIARWERSAIRAEALSHAVLRAEVPFFLHLESEYGDYLEGAIDLLCTDPGSTHALVIDYKTGDAGLTMEQIRERHAMQAGYYADVLLRLGYGSVECAFVCVELEGASGEPIVARYSFDSSNIHSLF
ncbi:MAG: PD-(D/E)XK nuclease family protein, partial [Coriobacteriaceae bacterium]|nr:PD-(D/E)XK nuclease family protein [Coriobacteriaceae bacterium]